MAELIDTDILSYGRKQVLSANMLGSGTGYATGTVSVAATTGVVTGSGTTFTAGMVGGIFTGSSAVSYLVTAFTSTTEITIKDLDGVAYTGGASTDDTYNIAGAEALAITKSNVYDSLVNLSTKLDQSLCPTEGRFIVVNGALKGVLRKAPEFIPAVNSAYNNVVEKGLLGEVAGFKVYHSELVDGNNTTGYWYIAGTKDFISFATQISKVSVVPSEADPNSFITTAKGLLVYGRKTFENNRVRGAVMRAVIS
jgi:hypothetical protein